MKIGKGGVTKLNGKRRRPYVPRIKAGYRDTGSIIYKNLGYYETYEEALDVLNKYIKNKYDIDQKKLTFAELYEEWSEKHFKKVSQSTVNGYKTAYKHCENIYNIRFTDLRLANLQRVLDEDCETYSIRKSVRVLFNVLYDYADSYDIVEKMYNKKVDIGDPVTVHDKQPFSTEEIQKLWDNKDKIAGVDTILILIYTSCRVNEILKEIEDANLDERWIKTGSKTKSRQTDALFP